MPIFQNAVNTTAIHSTFNEIAGNQIININHYQKELIEDLTRKAKLNPVDMSTFGRPSCLSNTRLDIIKDISDWIVSEHQKPVFWLFGQTGSGKSTISTTIANMSREQHRLGAFIFFNRDVKDRSDPSLVITTLAYKLASFDVRLGEAVSAAIRSISDIAESPLHFQFRKLVVEPLLSVGSRGPLVIIIDALDECGSAESRKILLSVLAREFCNLPPFTRILIASRPEGDINNILHSHPSVTAQELDIKSESAERDIETFIMSKMADVRQSKMALNLGSDWPGAEKISLLTTRAAGLFVWASTACTFISRCHDPRRNLDLLTGISVTSVPLQALDRLYETALLSAGDWSDDFFSSDCITILGLILVAKVPLLCESIDDILCLPRPTIHTIHGLRSILRWSDSEPVRILHPSFHDFLSDLHRCGSGQWFIDLNTHHDHISLHCIALLERRLRKNICNLVVREPFADRMLPESLSYACIYWIEHVCLAKKTSDNLQRIHTFLSRHLLHWMEVMSILKMSRRVIRELRQLYEWINPEDHDKLPQLISDARRFSQFFADAIEEHPLLIYATAIPFCPINTTIHELFRHDGMLRLTGAVLTGWPMLELQLRGHDKAVSSVAFSFDGSKIVSGSDDTTIRVWDVSTGTEILTPLRGHNDRVWSVAFSPDSSTIVSGSADETIRIWDTTTGTETLPPLRGHGGTVYSVAFSQDGSKIVSGSRDMTIRVWDALTGTEVLPPFGGHDNGVRSVAFSRDGSRIVSGSEDKTVRVWDITTGFEVVPPLRHRDFVYSVAFSNAGSKIVSGSGDGTIRVWDASTGAEILPPLKGHDDWYFSVAFSPDDSTIVSGSCDGAIRIWDVTNGCMISPPIRGHNSYIYSVAYSRNGSKIVSGSADHMIFVWDVTAASGALPSLQGDGDEVKCIAFSHNGSRIVAGSESGVIHVWDTSSSPEARLRGHEASVLSVAFSYDGIFIVSGSKDHTVRVWDAHTGIETIPPLRGHDDGVCSVAFSHNNSFIVSGSRDNTVRVWDTNTGTETLPPLRGHDNYVTSVAFSNDGLKIVSGSADWTIRIWDASTGTETLPPLRGHNTWVRSVAFSHDSSKIVSGSDDTTVRIWDTSTGVEILPPFRGHDGFVRSVAFSHGDSKIVSQSYDQTIRVWDASTGTEIRPCFDGPTIPINLILDDNTTTDQLRPTGLICLDENGWFTDITTGRYAKLPTGLEFSAFYAHDSLLVQGSGGLILIQFPAC